MTSATAADPAIMLAQNLRGQVPLRLAVLLWDVHMSRFA